MTPSGQTPQKSNNRRPRSSLVFEKSLQDFVTIMVHSGSNFSIIGITARSPHRVVFPTRDVLAGFNHDNIYITI